MIGRVDIIPCLNALDPWGIQTGEESNTIIMQPTLLY